MNHFKGALAAAIAIFSLVAGSASSQATLILTNDEASFGTLGTIPFISTFEDFGDTFEFPGDPFTRGGVTYTSGANITVGVSSGYPVPTTVISYNFWTPLTGNIDNYTMFGFDIGVQFGSTITFTIFTNVGNYVFANQSVAEFPDMGFFGFYTPDEILTGFQIDVDAGAGALTGLTNVRVGNVGVVQVPEPATMALFAAGLLGLGLMSRRRKTDTAEA